MKVHNALMDLNKEIYKSKNQFIIEALLFYLEALEKNPLTGSGKQKVCEKDMLITKEEMDDAVATIKNDLIQYVNKEVLTTIISVLGNNLNTNRVQVTNDYIRQNKNNDVEVDDRLIELASSWS